MKYFFDNCVSPKIVDILRLAGAEDDEDELVHIKDVDGLTRDELDPKWIPVVADRGWTAVTIDHRIKSRPHERAILEDSKMRLVLLPKGYHDLGRWQQTCFILNYWPGIAKATRRCSPGDRFLISMHGKVEVAGKQRR